jgi:2-polyprenyl-6-methoxyphenol hydroxylase-like FAD-dependent oxidoreductase
MNANVAYTPSEQVVTHVDCAIVGGGPAGAVLALLLARKGVQVALLEEHRDFNRDFRGDTIHPSVLEIMDELGLADRLLQLPHAKVSGISEPINVSFKRLKTRFPYIMILPQADFLDFVVGEARKYPSFHLFMGARVEGLIEEDGAVRGMRFRQDDEQHELHATLTVAADGRFSKVRKLLGWEPIKTSPPMDVRWFRLPRRAEDGDMAFAAIRHGHMFVALKRPDDWQIAFVIAKGSYKEVRAAGIEAFRRVVADLAPRFADRITRLEDWNQMALLSVESNRLPRWHKPGLLLIGDAAHTMSPVGGVGINYAIQDAVVTANSVTAPLLHGTLTEQDLAAVQRRREWPTRIIQWLQTLAQKQVIARALASSEEVRPPLIMRLLLNTPYIRDIPPRLVGLGVWPVHVRG